MKRFIFLSLLLMFLFGCKSFKLSNQSRQLLVGDTVKIKAVSLHLNESGWVEVSGEIPLNAQDARNAQVTMCLFKTIGENFVSEEKEVANAFLTGKGVRIQNESFEGTIRLNKKSISIDAKVRFRQLQYMPLIKFLLQ